MVTIIIWDDEHQSHMSGGDQCHSLGILDSESPVFQLVCGDAFLQSKHLGDGDRKIRNSRPVSAISKV